MENVMANLVARHLNALKQRHYLCKAEPGLDYWFNFSQATLARYLAKYGEDFDLVLYGRAEIDDDFFVLPFKAFAHVFDEKYLANDKLGRKRWIGSITLNELRVRNCPIRPDVFAFYGAAALLRMRGFSPSSLSDDERNDYAIESRKAEIKVRQKQSLFRKRVLTNFGGRCCLSGIKEADLLVASHIVPWSENVKSRLDPGNGLCLFTLYDSLFDRGYFSLADDLTIVLTPRADGLSAQLGGILRAVEGRTIIEPQSHPIKGEYVRYHRENKLLR
jgi:putative restriction endonuclease